MSDVLGKLRAVQASCEPLMPGASPTLLLVRDAADEIEQLRAALDALRGRYRLYAGWPEMTWAGQTDIKLLKMADDVLGDAKLCEASE